jgi:hypothetical protein
MAADAAGYQHWSDVLNQVYTLGNGWISAGDVIWDQTNVMDVAQFNLINGGWTSDASLAFTDAFSALQTDAQSIAESCWATGTSSQSSSTIAPVADSGSDAPYYSTSVDET